MQRMVSIASEHKHLPRIMFMLSKPMLKPEKSEQSSNVSFAWFTIQQFGTCNVAWTLFVWVV